MEAPCSVAQKPDTVEVSEKTVQDLLESAARAWCVPKDQSPDNWQEFVKLSEPPSIDWSTGVARAKFEYLERDEVLCSVDSATVEYDIRAGKLIGIKLRLRQQLNHLGHGMAQKIDQVDRDTQQFMESTAQRMNGLGDELDLKAASSSVDILEDRIAKAIQAMDRKAEATAFRRLEEQVLQIGGYVETKAEMSQLQAAGEALKALEQDVCKMATANEMEWVKRQMKDLRLTCSERVFGTNSRNYLDFEVSHGFSIPKRGSRLNGSVMSSVEPLDSVLPAGSGVEAVRKLREVTDVDGSDSWNSYFQNHGLDTVLTEMVTGLAGAEPEDPIEWMIRHLVQHRMALRDCDAVVSPKKESEKKAGKKGKKMGINISACLRRGCRPLLDIVCDENSRFEQIEDASNTQAVIFFVWSGQGLLQRLNHPGATEKIPRLPSSSWVNRFPGIGYICDKVNMALALRLLQKMWPEKFRFWPKSWLLPAEVDELCTWLDKHKSDTVIVKPEGGSQGDGIFLVQNSSDLRLKLSAKPHFGAGFGALAQRYLPDPLLLDGLKFDLRLYVVVTAVEPLCAYLCREGLARFCTAKYETPTAANANEAYMHLTNYSVNKKSSAFKDEDPFNVHTKASKRPLSTLLSQMAAQEAAEGRTFDEEKLFRSFEEVCAVLLQAMAPVMKVTYDRVAKESKPKPKKTKAKSPKKGKADSEEEDEEEEDEDLYEPNCFQILGVDVLLDSALQPWLLEVNARPSMDISNPLRLSDAPPGTRRCVCRDMDGEEHCHVHSEVDVRVKRLVVDGALHMAAAGGEPPAPEGFVKMDFDRYSPSEAQETLAAVARIFQEAGGSKKAFTTSGVRRTLANAVNAGMPAHEMDTLVTKWKHQGYRQDIHSEDDNAEIGVLDFASLLQEIALVRSGKEEDPLDALVSLIELCDPGG
ncbi:Tubulin polyglutamylase TTLL11 (Tubulin--tyrosine ligase-like protein 11) [Durusdinium trenchii]